MKALIVEDNVAQLNGTAIMISESFRDIECLKAASYDEGIRLINENVINFFLLDIQLGNDPDKDGIALGEYIRSLDGYQTTPILFVTALVDQAVRAIHSTNCYDYITKPYDQSELLKAIQRLLNLSMVEDPLVELKDINGVYMRIKPDDIYYIKSELHNMHVHTVKESFVTSGIRLNDLEAETPSFFIRCHRSYLVNAHHIRSYDKQNATILLDTPRPKKIPVGRKYLNMPELQVDFEDQKTTSQP